MLNTIRADFYRLFRSKSFYITQLISLLIVVGSILAQKIGTVMEVTKNDSSAAPSALGQEDLVWTGVQSLQNLSIMSALVVYFCIALFVITIGYDLSRGMLKNMLTSGISRERFFVSKYIVFLLVTGFQFILYYGSAFVTGTLLHGVGDFSLDFLKDFLTGVGLQFLFLQAIFAIGICILYFTFTTVWAVLSIIVIPLVITIVSVLSSAFNWVTYFDFSTQMRQAMLEQPFDNITKLMSAALGTIIVLIGIAFYNFKKKEL